MPDVLSIDDLKSAGFNDTEIKDHVQTQSTDLIGAGFSQQEINNYFGVKEPNISRMVDFWKTSVSGAFTDEDKQKLNDPNISAIDLQQTIENVKLKVWGMVILNLYIEKHLEIVLLMQCLTFIVVEKLEWI